MSKQPTIAVIGTGGTISNRGTGEVDYLNYVDRGHVLDLEETLEHLPSFDVAHLVAVPHRALRSRAMGISQWLQLREVATRLTADPQIDGIVITHGTGLIEETGYFLHLTLQTDTPVVLVGAQRPPTTLSSDAQLNFLDAVRVAGSASMRAMGVAVVMNQTIHSARDVTKMSNHSLGAMESPHAGVLGTINVNGRVQLVRRPHTRHTGSSRIASALGDAGAELGDSDFPRVDVIYQHADFHADTMRSAVDGARGLVVVGFPPGVNTAGVDEFIDEAIDTGVTVVQASRGRGPVILRESMQARGIVANTDLSPQHARILLQLALRTGLGNEAQAIFNSH